MKEMTIEQKAKAYDEAKARMSKAYNSNRCTIGYMNEIFPDIEEREDERIRKAIGYAIGQSTHSDGTLINGVYSEEALAWLKKQGEQKTVDEIAKEVCKNKESAMAFLKSAGIMNEKGELAEQYRQDEQKPADKVETKFKVGDVVTNKKSKDTVKIVQILHDSYCYSGWNGAATVHSDFSISEQDDWELVEQNPSWSEEDDIYIENIILAVEKQYPIAAKNIVSWLKSLKDRVQPQPKQEWSEDDERCLVYAIDACETASDDYDNSQSYIDAIKWLKSLRPQNTWKPSDEQMDALHYVTNFDYGGYKATLVSLYEQLKKLKG